MNEGFNHIGNDLRRTTRFVIGCTFNPNAKNLDAQISRLERKLAATKVVVLVEQHQVAGLGHVRLVGGLCGRRRRGASEQCGRNQHGHSHRGSPTQRAVAASPTNDFTSSSVK